MGFLDDITRDINQAFGEVPQRMTELFQQFLREANAVWSGQAWAINLYGVAITCVIKQLESGHEGVEMMAPAFTPPSVRILRRRGWGMAPVPPWVVPLTTLPVVSEDRLSGMVIQSDEPEPNALKALEPTWDAVVRSAPYCFLASDGVAVTAQVVPPVTGAALHALASAVAAQARSSGIAQTLALLEGASVTRSAELAPSVALKDGVELGVQGGVYLIARLGGMGGVTSASGESSALLKQAGDPHLHVSAGVATLTWPTIERDHARIKAGVAALRRLASGGGPYR
jgi:hypothetical protein